jgi:hypothetical protein
MPRGINIVDEARIQRRLWTPEILGLALWFDASDISTISVATGVSEWRDKSRNARHVSQATGANQPAYTVGGLNGLNVLTFDGTNDFMSNTAYSFPTVYSIYAVGRSSATSYSRLLNVGGSTDLRGFLGTGSSNSNYATFFGNGTNWNDILSNTPNQSIASTSILGVVKDNAVAGATPYVNGIAQNTKNGTTTTGTGFIFGKAATPEQYWNGIIAEVIIQSSLSTNLQRLAIEGYLAHKWGLQRNLPASHPFANRPPLIGD